MKAIVPCSLREILRENREEQGGTGLRQILARGGWGINFGVENSVRKLRSGTQAEQIMAGTIITCMKAIVPCSFREYLLLNITSGFAIRVTIFGRSL